MRDLRRFDRGFAVTNELRTKGTDNLLAAAKATGVQRFVAQSYTGWPNIREDGPIKNEQDPLDPHPPAQQSQTLAAIRYLEQAVLAAPFAGVVVRYGNLYGPGASEQLLALIQNRRMPIVGSGSGIWSWIHVDDAASATVAAIERGEPGVYNVVDDEPAPLAQWLPHLATTIGAEPPRHVPVWLGRLVAGEVGVSMMTRIRGSSNAKAKRELHWQPKPCQLAGRLPRVPGQRPGTRPAGGARDIGGVAMGSTESFEALRPLLFSLAYRMLGSVSEAEDIVQEAFLRQERAVGLGAEIELPRAYLSAVVTRLSIDHLRSARARREVYVGQWLPEPLLTDDHADLDPAIFAEQADSLSLAFLVLLEQLNPVERAVFLLHDVFGYGYDEIARTVDKSEDNCRQLATRARRHIEEQKPRFEASQTERERLAARFFAAVSDGEVEPLVEMLAADVVVYGDGGGKSPSWPRPIFGRDPVSRLFAGLGGQLAGYQLTIELREVNGQPGATIVDSENRIVNVFSLDIVDGVVQTIRSVIKPDKLRHLGPIADVRALMRQHRSDQGAN